MEIVDDCKYGLLLSRRHEQGTDNAHKARSGPNRGFATVTHEFLCTLRQTCDQRNLDRSVSIRVRDRIRG